jgi:hypothetical protein
LGLPLGQKVGKLLREAPLLRDGRRFLIPVLDEDEVDAEDVEQLLRVKVSPVGGAE